MGDQLLQDALGAIAVAHALLDIGQLEQRVRHLGVGRVGRGDLREGLAGALQVTLGQVDLAQPVLGVAGVLALRVLAQEGAEGLAGLVEILGLDQVEGSVVIQLFLRRVGRFVAGCRSLAGLPAALIAPSAGGFCAGACAPAAPPCRRLSMS